MQETILLLRRQLDSLLSDKSSKLLQQNVDNNVTTPKSGSEESLEIKNESKNGIHPYEETCIDENTPTSVMSLNRIFSHEDSKESSSDAFTNSQLLEQVIFLNFLSFFDTSVSCYSSHSYHLILDTG